MIQMELILDQGVEEEVNMILMELIQDLDLEAEREVNMIQVEMMPELEIERMVKMMAFQQEMFILLFMKQKGLERVI